MSDTAQSIITSLNGLPRSEVDDVRKHINAMLSLGVWDADPDDDTSDARRVFHILAEEMQAAGLIDMRSVSYKQLRNRRSFATKAEHIVAFLNEQHRTAACRTASSASACNCLFAGCASRPKSRAPSW